MVNTSFQNHEIVKILLAFPVLSPTVIYSALFFSLFYRRKQKEVYSFLCRQVTVELRGIAILLVVVGHIGAHVLVPGQQRYFPVLGQYGVSIFFLLSGFGLARSYAKKQFCLKEFIKRRLSRVMIPYWIVTVIIVTLDVFFLNRGYKVSDIVETALGFNISASTRSIDYVRWYITVLLFWYVVFVLYWRKDNSRKIKVISFFSIGVLLTFSDYYLFPIGYAYLSFPFGIWAGLYYSEIVDWYTCASRKRMLFGSMLIIIATCLFNMFIVKGVDILLPTIAMSLIAETTWLLIASCLAIIASLVMPYQSPFLSIFGKYSYGIFLVHGALMIKYDFILFRGDLFVTFWIYLAVVLLLAIAMEEFIFKNIAEVKLLH